MNKGENISPNWMLISPNNIQEHIWLKKEEQQPQGIFDKEQVVILSKAPSMVQEIKC